MTVTAPKAKSFATVETGTYDATVHDIDINDYTETPYQYSPQDTPRYGHRFIFKWEIDGQVDDEGEPIIVYQYVWFETGSNPRKSGQRAGKLPQLTEITRAFGEPDIQPLQEVDERAWVGKQARLTILEEVKPDGTTRNKVNAVMPRKANGAKPPAAGVRYMSQDQADKLLAKLAEFKQVTGRDYPEEIVDPLPVADLKRIVEDINARILEFEKVPF